MLELKFVQDKNFYTVSNDYQNNKYHVKFKKEIYNDPLIKLSFIKKYLSVNLSYAHVYEKNYKVPNVDSEFCSQNPIYEYDRYRDKIKQKFLYDYLNTFCKNIERKELYGWLFVTQFSFDEQIISIPEALPTQDIYSHIIFVDDMEQCKGILRYISFIKFSSALKDKIFYFDKDLQLHNINYMYINEELRNKFLFQKRIRKIYKKNTLFQEKVKNWRESLWKPDGIFSNKAWKEIENLNC